MKRRVSIVLCIALIFSLMSMPSAVYADDISDYEAAYKWLMSIGYPEKVLDGCEAEAVIDIYGQLQNKKLAYGEDVEVQASGYGTNKNAAGYSDGETRGVISPQKLELGSVIINYQKNDKVIAVVVMAHYRWITKPIFLSWNDAMALTWDASMFSLPESYYIDYTSLAKLKPGGSAAILRGTTVGDIRQGFIAWPVSLCYDSTQTKEYAGYALVTLEPRYATYAGDDVDCQFILQYGHKPSKGAVVKVDR